MEFPVGGAKREPITMVAHALMVQKRAVYKAGTGLAVGSGSSCFLHRSLVHMFKRTKVSTAAVVAIGTLVGSAALAQDTQRVEITGSSIKRIAAEGALPVITLTRKDIEQSGATSIRELVQTLPSMQGFTTPSDSVNAGGGGTTTASLRNLGSQYTLVLLNGRRVAPFNTGSTVNLEQLPIAAIERVEILSDGASTLYGADAIAGVVNFITRKNTTAGEFDLQASIPQEKGGKGVQASLSKGFGNLDSDGFNIFGGFSIEKEQKISAADREFSKSGIIPFDYNGRKLQFRQLSPNGTAPNITVVDKDEKEVEYNPLFALNGDCGALPGSASLGGGLCGFDYASTVEAKPESERKNLFLSGQLKLGKDISAFGEVMLSDSSLTGRFAPPAQGLLMPIGGALFNRYVAPTIEGRGVDVNNLDYIVYGFRLADAGLRADEFRTKAQHFVVGLEGSVFSFDGAVSYTHSQNIQTDTYKGGYSSRTKFNELVESGDFDPFAQGTEVSKAALAPALLNGTVASETKSSLDIVSLRGSRPVFAAAGGSAYLGFGVDLMRQKYTSSPSAITGNGTSSDFPIGSNNGQLPVDTMRDSRGAYAELLVPLTKALELTGALRYDEIDAAQNSKNFDNAGNPIAGGEQGNKNSKTTYKLGMRFQPIPEVLLRASIGTGFRAPTLDDITKPLAPFGVIGTQRACPVAAGDPLFSGCRNTPTQYNLQTGGNSLTGEAGLKPETSEQWNIGIRFEPNASISVGVDYWSVKVKDVLTVVPEDAAFDNFEVYRSLFAVINDAATGRPTLTLNQVLVNGAVAKSSGIDVDVTARAATSIGKLTGQFGGTYLVDSYFDYGFGGGKESSIGKLGSDDQVAFRTVLRMSATLESGAFTNSLTLQWKPGYTDQTYTADDGVIFERLPDGSPGDAVGINDFHVGSYTLVDWQGKWAVNKAFSITGGIKNLFDKQPPLSIKTVGGNMLGFDPRYADGVGRMFYLSGNYKF
jgi:iron complex outermembrane recepter protein